MKIKLLLSTLSFFTTVASAESVRPLAADRPDSTESPQTVDKGYFQIETSFADYAFDDKNGSRSKSLSLMETNFKYGVTDTIDFHLVVSPYINQEVNSSSRNESSVSHGDFQVRAKFNLWGNDAGLSAMALLPYLKIPSGAFSNDEYEGGLIVTYAAVVYGREVGVQLQLDNVYNENTQDRDWAGSHTLVTGYDLSEKVGGYLEYIGEYTAEEDYNPYFSFGWTWQTGSNSQWDIGSVVALNDQGEDYRLFSGYTLRFN